MQKRRSCERACGTTPTQAALLAGSTSSTDPAISESDMVEMARLNADMDLQLAELQGAIASAKAEHRHLTCIHSGLVEEIKAVKIDCEKTFKHRR